MLRPSSDYMCTIYFGRWNNLYHLFHQEITNTVIMCHVMMLPLVCFTMDRMLHVSLQDVHETAAGALWNLAFNPGNAWRIVEEGGVRALVHLCSSSMSKMARFMAALALAYMFDGRY